MVSALRERMVGLAEVSEEVIRLIQGHELEKRQLAEQLEREWWEERVMLERMKKDDQVAMEQRIAQLRAEFEQRLAEERAAVAKVTVETRAECRQMAEEKADITKRLASFRDQCEQGVLLEKQDMMNRMADFRAECERKVSEEKEAMSRRLAEARQQTEAQLQTERQITDAIKNAIRDLPPLQAAMELGDLQLLEIEVRKWRGDALPERFGECRGVVEAVVKLAAERLLSWRGVQRTLKDVLKEVEHLPASLAVLMQQCQRLFRALKEAQLTKMDLRRSDPQASERILEVFMAWQERAMCNPNSVHRAIVRKVVMWPQLGQFDFTDLEICLRLVDRAEVGSEVFLSRARAIVEDETTAPKDLRPLLSHVETMLFFLKYVKSEDLSLTHKEFRKQAAKLDRHVATYLARAEREYPPGCELVRLSEGQGLTGDVEISAVLEQIRRLPAGARQDSLGLFREIFFHWAVVMRSKFDLLVLPHHTQVVCLLAFRYFLEASLTGADPHALIAQVGTGEGKSMIIAALVIYVVVALGKKAHVVVDDETLLERDFWTFKPLFDVFSVPASGTKRPLSAVLCVSEERLAAEKGRQCLSARVDPEADVCYCEAKHVQSFYAGIARGEKRDFDGYDGRVLILDEVDALIIDEEPNEAFVYPNQELSEMATRIARALAGGAAPDSLGGLLNSRHPAVERVVREVMSEWNRGKQMKAGEDYVYSKELGRYCSLHAGRANPKDWSLALECRNLQDGLCTDILFQERLFVMSRPRVFRKYHRILGLSGSIGSDAERRFLKDTYRAVFFEVPPFLKTCRGSPFNEAVPVQLGSQAQAVYVEQTPEAQLARLAEVALEARERVPVLVIARDRVQADQLAERLRLAACSRGLGSKSDDMIRSLSRTLYEADPQQWKENLNRSTLPLGDGGTGGKSWRVTVTDPRGGRGTDYRVDDPTVDGRGGLLLIPTAVPTSQRDWTQYLGRTARQDRRGQFCAVLCSADYAHLQAKYGQPLGQGLEAVEAILALGDREAADRIRGSAALYNCGVRLNELCEDIFSRRPEALRDPESRERLVDICQHLRWMSVQEIDQAFARIPGFTPQRVPTEARDLGRPVEPSGRPVQSRGRLQLQPPQSSQTLKMGQSGTVGPPKVVIFCLDWSLSMLSQDTGTHLSRFATCVACIQRILADQVQNHDLVGVVGFGASVETVVLPTPKGLGTNQINQRVAQLQAQTLGGTCFFDAVKECLQLLGQPGLAPPEAPRWLICLTDGDDLGSRKENAHGEQVSQQLERGAVPSLNMVMITVGRLKEHNLKVIDGWVEQVSSAGGFARHLSERNAAAITGAFEVVAECLASDVGGATEC